MKINITYDSKEEVDIQYEKCIKNDAVEVQKPIERSYGLYESFIADSDRNLVELNCSL